MPIDFSDNRLQLAALVAIALGAGALSHSNPQRQQEAYAEQQSSLERRAHRNELRDEVRRRDQVAHLAMQRVRAGCVPVVLQDRPHISPNLTEGMGAFDEDGLLMSDGFICTVNSTAEVRNGVVTNVVPVPPKDLESYQAIFEQLQYARFNRFTEISPTTH